MTQTLNELNHLIFLGLHIYESLSWRTHTDTVKNKISKVVGILYIIVFIRTY